MGVFRSLRLSSEHARFADEIQRSLVDELYERAKVSLVVLVGALVALIRVFGPVYDTSPAIRGAFVALFVVVALRFALILVVGTGPTARGTPSARHLAFAVGATAAGALMGWINVLAFPLLSPARFGLCAMTLTGINSIALVSMGTSPAVYLGYMLSSLGPLTVVAALGERKADAELVPAMLVLYVSALVAMSLHEYRSRRDNVLLRLQLAELALQDSLTQVRNRRFLMEFMPEEVEQLLRTHRPRIDDDRALALMMIDLDRFKAINDAHGHEAGDRALRLFCERLRASLRRGDVVVRWGGEEFLVLLPDIDAERLPRLLRHIRGGGFGSRPEGGEMTASIGVAERIADRAPDWQSLVALADRRMYEAKRAGRDRALLPGERALEFGAA